MPVEKAIFLLLFTMSKEDEETIENEKIWQAQSFVPQLGCSTERDWSLPHKFQD